MRAERPAAIAGGALAAGVGLGVLAAFRRVLSTRERPCWPPPPTAVTPASAQAATEAFAADARARRRDAALPFAWSTAATAEPWVEGEQFFPRILADAGAARSSVHILMFGWREGEIGTELAALLAAKAAEGVAVRVLDRRLRLEALRPGAGDVHRARRGGRADRRQRRPPARPARPLPARAPHRSPPARARQRRPPQAVRDRRAGRVDGRRGHRGPLPRRAVPRRDDARHRRRRAAAAGRVPHELPRARRPPARRT